MYAFQHGIIASSNGGGAVNPLWDGLLAYYTADNTPNDALGTYNGTLTNGATYATGKINQGFSFDGVNDYVLTSPNMALNTSTQHTYACWVRPSAVYSTKFFMSLSDGIRNSSLGHINNGQLAFFRGSVEAQVLSGFSMVINTWYHVCVVYKGNGISGNVLFYVNGSLVSTQTLGITHTNNKPLTIGSSTVPSLFFDGILDECALWNRQLTASEVTELYNAGAGKQYPN